MKNYRFILDGVLREINALPSKVVREIAAQYPEVKNKTASEIKLTIKK